MMEMMVNNWFYYNRNHSRYRRHHRNTCASHELPETIYASSPPCKSPTGEPKHAFLRSPPGKRGQIHGVVGATSLRFRLACLVEQNSSRLEYPM